VLVGTVEQFLLRRTSLRWVSSAVVQALTGGVLHLKIRSGSELVAGWAAAREAARIKAAARGGAPFFIIDIS
jgi:hypothetical protein